MSLHSASQPSPDGSPAPRWWYGVACFPAVPFLSLLSVLGLALFVNIASTSADGAPPGSTELLLSLASFAVTVLASWLAVIVAVGVLAALALDLRALRRGDYGWRPSRAWALGGVVNVVAAELWPVYVVSLPALGYYLYRRRNRVGAP